MKLLDTLVEHLKDWPEQISHLWCGQGNSIYGNTGPFEFTFTGGWDLPDDHVLEIVTRAEWQAAVEALKAEQSAELRPTERAVEWDGVGLPPVGVSVEVIGLGNNYLPKSIEDWKDGDKVECVAHHAIQGEHVIPVFFNKRSVQFSSLREDCYRPIRTPEQIAAEEREKAIEEIRKDTDYILDEICASAVIAAGYRKQVTK